MVRGINRYLWVTLPVIILLLSSCNSSVLYTEIRVMPDKTWRLEDISKFRVPVQDTINGQNISFVIRSGTSYPYRNIYLFITVTSPQGKAITDTIQYNLADEKGKWYGKGFGDIHELELPYKTNVYFPRKGLYMFSVQHGMRIEDLKGVYDFGLRIEKVRILSGNGKK
jgi:gliding motility-associated lipoprotein GldH